MPIAVCGSIATDHLMHFPGKFTDSLLPEHLHRVSLSFLVDDLVVRRGGVAANIAFGMGVLGVAPLLVGAVGPDFADYGSWLERHGVDCTHVLRCDDVQTARFVCTTDDDMNQIASFYEGAMGRARDIELGPIARSAGGLDLVVIGAESPDTMTRHAEECRVRGFAFAADPSQQLARMDGPETAALVDGAAVFFSNDYEFELLQSKTGWTAGQMLDHVAYRVTTLGARGCEIVGRDSRITVPAAAETGKVDPTGVGDAFRAGFLSAQFRGLSLERSAQLGSMMATLVLEKIGTQEYDFTWRAAADRLTENYGGEATADILRAMGALDLV